MNNINSAFLETKVNNRLNALRLLFANESLSRTEIASKRVFRKWSYHTV